MHTNIRPFCTERDKLDFRPDVLECTAAGIPSRKVSLEDLKDKTLVVVHTNEDKYVPSRFMRLSNQHDSEHNENENKVNSDTVAITESYVHAACTCAVLAESYCAICGVCAGENKCVCATYPGGQIDNNVCRACATFISNDMVLRTASQNDNLAGCVSKCTTHEQTSGTTLPIHDSDQISLCTVTRGCADPTVTCTALVPYNAYDADAWTSSVQSNINIITSINNDVLDDSWLQEPCVHDETYHHKAYMKYVTPQQGYVHILAH